MKNRLVYYLVIIVPIVIVGLLRKTEMINSVSFVIALAVYALIFRTYTDGRRLADKGIIKETDIWKMIIPGQRIKYFKDLYIR